MQAHPSKSPSIKKKIIRRLWFWILIGVVVVGVLFFTLLPVGMDYGIKRYLKDQGADQVNLADVDFNPITGRMTLRDLAVIIGARTALEIQEVTLNIRWTPFIRKRLALEQLKISDTELIVEKLEDGGWQIGGISIPQQKEASEHSTWGFSLQEATIDNSRIEFVSPRLKSSLDIEHAKIFKLTSWMPRDKARLEFKGKLNGARLQLQTDVTPFGRSITASGNIKIEGLNLTPFSHLLQPQVKSLQGRLDLDLTVETRQNAKGGFSYRQKGPVKLYQIQTQIADMNLSKENLAWDGTIGLNTPKPQETIKIAADGQLSGSTLRLNIENEKLKVQEGNFSWKGKFDYGQDKTSRKITADGQISLVDLKVTSPQFNLSEDKLTWQGPVEFSSGPETAGQKIIADGRLNGSMLSMNLEEEDLRVQQDDFSWKGKFDFAQDRTSRKITTDGQISLIDLKVASPQFNLSEDKLAWQGPVEFSTTANSESQRIIADGALDGSHLQMSLPGRRLKFEHQGLSWKGRLDTGETNDFSALKAEADVTLKDIQMLQSETNRRLLSTDKFDLQAIKVDSLNTVNVSGIVLNGLALLAEPKTAPSVEAGPSPLRIQEVRFKNARLSRQKNLAVDAVQLTGVKGFLHRDREGKWPAIDRLASLRSDNSSGDQTQRATSDIPAKEKSDKLDFRIGQVDIAGDSELRFKDESVNPAFAMDLSILEARLADLDSSQPQQPASIKLLASNTKNARLSLEGTLLPFAGQLNLDWVGKIRAFELPQLSPYVIRSTGYRFTSGELEADVPLKIDRNELKGEIDLKLLNPRIKRVKAKNSGEKQQGKIRLNMTLDSALRLLRDEQNDVKLKIPISGDINDPHFSVADAVNQVLAKTLEKSAISYLKYMLGPYGIGISIAQFAYDQATKIRLNPILFAPGIDELDEAAIDYLQRVAAIMKEYPEVQVSVCGVATESDREAMNQNASTDAALLALAQNRRDSIENQLVKLNGIEANRIIACEPEIDKSAEAKPRADLEI